MQKFIRRLEHIWKWGLLVSLWNMLILTPLFSLLIIFLIGVWFVFFIVFLFNFVQLQPLSSFQLPEPNLSHLQKDLPDDLQIIKPFSDFCYFAEKYVKKPYTLSQEESLKVKGILNTHFWNRIFGQSHILKDFVEVQNKEYYLAWFDTELFKKTNNEKLLALKDFTSTYCWDNKQKQFTEGILETRYFLLTEEELLKYKDIISQKVEEKIEKEEKKDEKEEVEKKENPNEEQKQENTNDNEENPIQKLTKEEIEFKEWYEKKYQSQYDFQENDYFEIMKTLWKIDTLKAFISWKYYLTYTSPEKNIYKTDPLYKYMIVRNPFINKASITKVFPYNEKNAFFEQFNWKTIEEISDTSTPIEIDITEDIKRLWYTWVDNIKVIANDEKKKKDFIIHLEEALNREYWNWDWYSKETYTLQICLANPIKSNKTFGFNEYYTQIEADSTFCMTINGIHLKDEMLHSIDDGILLISLSTKELWRAKTLQVSYSLFPYFEWKNTYYENVLQQISQCSNECKSWYDILSKKFWVNVKSVFFSSPKNSYWQNLLENFTVKVYSKLLTTDFTIREKKIKEEKLKSEQILNQQIETLYNSLLQQWTTDISLPKLDFVYQEMIKILENHQEVIIPNKFSKYISTIKDKQIVLSSFEQKEVNIKNKADLFKRVKDFLSKKKGSAINPYIIPYTENEYEALNTPSMYINPLISIFKTLPDNKPWSKKDMAEIEKEFNSFLVYSNLSKNNLFVNPSLDIWELFIKQTKQASKYITKKITMKDESNDKIDILTNYITPQYYKEFEKLIIKRQNWEEIDDTLLPKTLKSFQEWKESKHFEDFKGVIKWKLTTLNEKYWLSSFVWEEITLSKKEIYDIIIIEKAYHLSDWKLENFLKLTSKVSQDEKNLKELFNVLEQIHLLEKNKQQTYLKMLYENTNEKERILKSLLVLLLESKKYYTSLPQDETRETVKGVEWMLVFQNKLIDDLKDNNFPWLNNYFMFLLSVVDISEENINLFRENLKDFDDYLQDLFDYKSQYKKVNSLLEQWTLVKNQHYKDINKEVIRESYNFWDLFTPTTKVLDLIFKNKEDYSADALLWINVEDYVSIIGYNYYSYQTEKKRLWEITWILKELNKVRVDNDKIKQLEWDWFKDGLKYISCEEDSKCEKVISKIATLKDWNEFNNYINELILVNKDNQDIVNVLKDLLDKVLYFWEKPRVTDIWDIADFWNDEIKECDELTDEHEKRNCKLLKVRHWKFNLSWYNTWAKNWLTWQCVRWANVLHKYFNKALNSCWYNLDWWDQWASYGWLQHWEFQWMIVGTWWRNRNAASCSSNVKLNDKEFWTSPQDLPRFCPVKATEENLQNWLIKPNMIAVVWWPWWSRYGHVVYIWWVDRSKGKVGSAEMNYRSWLALSDSIDSLTVRQSLVPVDKYKIYFDLDKPFSLSEIQKAYWLESVDNVNNEMIDRYCQNYF